MICFAILNKNNICESIVRYNQELRNPPENYILISENQDVLWHKYENGTWSNEKFEPIGEVIETVEDKLDWLILNSKGLI